MNRALCQVLYSGCGGDVRFMTCSKLLDPQRVGSLSFPVKKLFRLHGRRSLQVGFQGNGDHGHHVVRTGSEEGEGDQSVDMSSLGEDGGDGAGHRSAEQVPLMQKLSSFWRKESSRNSDREGDRSATHVVPIESCQFIPPACCQSSCGACCSESETHHVDVTPHSEIARDKEYFATFLNRVPAAKRKRIAQMAHLSNLAYRIATIEEEQLFRHHHYRVVTSSMELRAVREAAGDAEDDAAGESDDRSAEMDESMASLNPAAGYAMAATAASCNAQACDLLLSKSDAPEKCDAKTGDANSAPRNPWYLRTAANVLRSSPGAPADPEMKPKPASPPPDCPCEWFACEKEATSTLVIAIQGTETLAAWQANLQFEPTQFEPELNSGVMVHRGIYEAAKVLYEAVLPCIRAHMEVHKGSARLQFTGHSLGGSLAALLSLMVGVRHEAPISALLPVYAFGSPCIMCGGNQLLAQMGLPHSHIQSVIMHRDIVPRTFACDYPDHVAVVLKRVSGTFRNHTCLLQQRLIYAPMGEMVIMQPDEDQAPGHPLLPRGSGLYSLRMTVPHHKNPLRELQSAERAFLNLPHPLEILSDRNAYGSDGTISRDHDCRNYLKVLQRIRCNELKQRRRALREFRRQLWAPLVEGSSSADVALSHDYGDQPPRHEGDQYQHMLTKSSPGKSSHFFQFKQKRSGPSSLN